MTRTNVSDKQIIDILKELPTKKDLVILKSEILQEMDHKLAQQKVSIDQKLAELPTRAELNQRLEKLREDINNDIKESVMPMVYNHDARLDRVDKHLGFPDIPVQIP